MSEKSAVYTKISSMRMEIEVVTTAVTGLVSQADIYLVILFHSQSMLCKKESYKLGWEWVAILNRSQVKGITWIVIGWLFSAPTGSRIMP